MTQESHLNGAALNALQNNLFTSVSRVRGYSPKNTLVGVSETHPPPGL
jgi:hypothetical protein